MARPSAADRLISKQAGDVGTTKHSTINIKIYNKVKPQ